MHILVVNHGVPSPTTNGGPATVWAFMLRMLERGYRISLAIIAYDEDYFLTGDRIEAVRTLGVEVILLPVSKNAKWPSTKWTRLKKVFTQFDPRPFWHSAHLQRDLKGIIHSKKVDAIFAYHWDSMAPLYGISGVKKIGVAGDPWHYPFYQRWKDRKNTDFFQYLRQAFPILLEVFSFKRAMVKLLNDFDYSGSFQAHEVTSFRKLGAQELNYVRTAVVEPELNKLSVNKEPLASNEKPVILIGPSCLNITSTSAGLVVFAKEILPILLAELGEDGFVARLVGEGTPPPEIQELLHLPCIEVVGRVEPPDEEFLQATVQLVATPYIYGIRVRIITGLAYGCCIVSNQVESCNIPELKNAQNCFLAENGKGLAKQIIRVVRDVELQKKIRKNARATYEQFFKPEKAVEPVINFLESNTSCTECSIS